MIYIKIPIDCNGKYCGECRFLFKIANNWRACAIFRTPDLEQCMKIQKTKKGILRCKQCLKAEVKKGDINDYDGAGNYIGDVFENNEIPTGEYE